MSIETSWVDEACTLIQYRFGKTWTIDELHQALERGRAFMAEVEHPVDSLFDFSETSHIPQQMLPSIHQVKDNTPDNLRFSIAFGVNKFLIMLVQVIQTIAPGLMKDFRLVRTRAEALKLLEDMRQRKPGQ
jgi:hypothetical protein